ncbi:MAG: hypothetical protein ACKO3G_07830, partial [Planctomycetaceae bacterium]
MTVGGQEQRAAGPGIVERVGQEACQGVGLAVGVDAVEGEGGGEAHARGRVVEEADERGGIVGGEGHGGLAHLGGGIGGGAGRIAGLEPGGGGEDPPRAPAREGGGRPAGGGAEGVGGRGGGGGHEEPVGGVAAPAEGVAEIGDEGLPVGGGEHARGGQAGGGEDAVDAPPIVAGAEIEAGLHRGGDVVGVLDDVALHVGQVQRAVGTGLDGHRAEGGIGRGEELAVGLLGGARAAEDGAVVHEAVAVDEVRDHVADQGARGEPVGEGAAVEEAHAAGGGEAAGLLGMVGARGGDRDREEGRRGAVVGDAGGGEEGLDVAGALDLLDGHDPREEVVDVVGGEGVAGVVADEAEAAAGAEGAAQPAAVGIEGEVGAAQVERGGRQAGLPPGLAVRGTAEPGDAAAVAAVG